jgi:hypothetical protein
MSVAIYDEDVAPAKGTAFHLHITVNNSTNVPSPAVRTLPASIAKDEVFYWSQRWQADELESIRELAAGESRDFASSSEAIRWLLDPTTDD